jgi:hypothetical protein
VFPQGICLRKRIFIYDNNVELKIELAAAHPDIKLQPPPRMPSKGEINLCIRNWCEAMIEVMPVYASFGDGMGGLPPGPSILPYLELLT